MRGVFCGADVGVQETLEHLGVEFSARSDESDASDATRIISCVGLRVVAFVWSSDWSLSESQQQSHQCTTTIFVYLSRAAVPRHTHTQPFYGPFTGTTRVSSRCQKRTSGLYGARED